MKGMVSRKTWAVTAGMLVLGLAGTCGAWDLIGVNMTDLDGTQSTVAQETFGVWTNATPYYWTTVGRVSKTPFSALVDSTNTATSVGIASTTADRDRKSDEWTTTPDDGLLDCGWYIQAAGAWQFTVTGLAASASYKLIVYMPDIYPSETVTANGSSAIDYTGTHPTYLDAFDGITGADFWYFEVAADGNGELLVEVEDDGTDAVSGFQIQPLPSPGALAFTNATYSVTEGNSGTNYLSIGIERIGGESGSVTVDFMATNITPIVAGEAEAGSDFVYTNGTLTLPNGITETNFLVGIVGDAVYEEGAGEEDVERLQLTLRDPGGGATLGTQSNALLRIVDDDTPAGGFPPTVTNLPPIDLGNGVATLRGKILETNDSAVTACFFYYGDNDAGDVVTGEGWDRTNRIDSGDFSEDATVTWEVTDLFDDDLTGTVFYRFAATNQGGQADFEGESTWFLASNLVVTASGGAAEPAEAAGTGTPGTFTVHRAAGATNYEIEVSYALGGGATYGENYNGGDYTLTPLPTGTVTLAAGQAGTNIVITPEFDLVAEGESVTLTLQPLAGVFCVDAAPATHAIADVDASGLWVADDGSAINPGRFSSLSCGPLDLDGSEEVVFNTSNLVVTVDGTPKAPGGTNAYAQSGLVRLAAFTFSSIDLGENVSVTVTGNQGLALLSLSDIAVNTLLSVSGQSDTNGAGGLGGPGAEGGTRTNAFVSNPPGPDRGDGGASMSGEGVGYGAGSGETHGGGGAGYGGGGGAGNTASGEFGYPGTNYGSHLLYDLYGGSGGGGAKVNSGGGGGGSLQLSAKGAITVGASGLLAADGGDTSSAYEDAGGGERCSGGGSGGAILLVGREIALLGATNVTAEGGSTFGRLGGAGGGGRVVFISGTDWELTMESPYTNHPGAVAIEGGIADGTSPGDPGGRGTFYYSAEAPEWTKVTGALFILR